MTISAGITARAVDSIPAFVQATAVSAFPNALVTNYNFDYQFQKEK